jgi:Cu2+-containing amine oxidase
MYRFLDYAPRTDNLGIVVSNAVNNYLYIFGWHFHLTAHIIRKAPGEGGRKISSSPA